MALDWSRIQPSRWAPVALLLALGSVVGGNACTRSFQDEAGAPGTTPAAPAAVVSGGVPAPAAVVSARATKPRALATVRAAARPTKTTPRLAVEADEPARAVRPARPGASPFSDGDESGPPIAIPPPPDRALSNDAAAGERLFLETRFAQFYFEHSSQDVNAELARGDPTLDTLVGTLEDMPGPFAGASMSCRACHLVAELQRWPTTSARQYADYFAIGIRNDSDLARRSPIPDRGDGFKTTTRNSPTLVNVTATPATLLHLDGEFVTPEALIAGTFTGRNFGWKASERRTAIAHIARVIREDDGRGALSQAYGGVSYAATFAGVDPKLPSRAVISPSLRFDVLKATDDEVMQAVARLVRIYLDSLRFQTDGLGQFSGSPYDAFLRKNKLPARPDANESGLDYARRLRSLASQLASPAWISSADGSFQVQTQPFVFGRKQYEGLLTFLSEPGAEAASVASSGTLARHAANCVACHLPPSFTDSKLHNIGTTQSEYDSLHGVDSFNKLEIPTLAARREAPDDWLPASTAHPDAHGPFASVPDREHPLRTDLGAWNVFANDALPEPQARLRALLGASDPPTDADLARTVALFKTPTLRDLGQSAPYFHTGGKDSLEAVIQHYIDHSALARAGRVRNADRELARISIDARDVETLRAFLRSLNEDYR